MICSPAGETKLFLFDFLQIATHLENEYISARRSGVDDQTSTVLNESKRYLTQSLAHLVNDLGVISDEFNQLLHLQEYSIDSLASQTNILQSRLTTSKNQKIYSALDEMQVPYRQETKAAAVRELSFGELSTPAHLRDIQLGRK